MHLSTVHSWYHAYLYLIFYESSPPHLHRATNKSCYLVLFNQFSTVERWTSSIPHVFLRMTARLTPTCGAVMNFVRSYRASTYFHQRESLVVRQIHRLQHSVPLFLSDGTSINGPSRNIRRDRVNRVRSAACWQLPISQLLTGGISGFKVRRLVNARGTVSREPFLLRFRPLPS